MATVSGLYNYPITLTSDECLNNTGLDLYQVLEGDDSERKVVNFLNTIHSLVYDNLIFSVGPKTVKLLILEKFKTDLQNDIKKALISQGWLFVGERRRFNLERHGSCCERYGTGTRQ